MGKTSTQKAFKVRRAGGNLEEDPGKKKMEQGKGGKIFNCCACEKGNKKEGGTKQLK